MDGQTNEPISIFLNEPISVWKDEPISIVPFNYYWGTTNDALNNWTLASIAVRQLSLWHNSNILFSCFQTIVHVNLVSPRSEERTDAAKVGFLTQCFLSEEAMGKQGLVGGGIVICQKK